MKYFIFLLLLLVFKFSYSQPSITVIGEQRYCIGEAIPIVNSVDINDQGTLNQVIIQISEGYETGDLLELTGNHPNISASWSTALGQLTLLGPASIQEFETAILATQFSTTQTLFTANRRISVNLTNANYLPSTGHYYVYVPQFGITWGSARDQAANMNLFGIQGYLATITSVEEAQFSGEQTEGAGWIGATDEQTEGTWQWVTGPEAGTVFYRNGVTVNGEFSFWNNFEPNNFGGNEDYAHITDPSIGIPGSWNDLPFGGDPDVNSPYHPQGYIVEFGGMPGDPQINLSDASTIIMPFYTIEQVPAICEGDEVTITVTSNVDDVLWYDTENSSTIIHTGNTLTVQLNTTEDYWILPRFSSCTNQNNRQRVVVNVNPAPEFSNISIQQCGSLDNGTSIFTLTNFEQEIANGEPNRNITFFEDNNLTMPISATAYENDFNGQVIYAKVENTITNCFSIAEVTLNVLESANTTIELVGCDADDDGFTTFNLSEAKNQILIDFPESTVTFHLSNNEALQGINAIENETSFTNTMPNGQTVYAKATNNNTCLGVFEINLVLQTIPTLLPNETLYYCLNSFPEPITLRSGLINVSPDNFTYTWSPNNETSSSIEVNETGEYSVEVTNITTGCSSTRVLTVLASNSATIEDIHIEDAMPNNSVTITVLGEGDYEFSLTSETGPYQGSNRFDNVKAGFQTIYIRDKNGCGILSREISVIGYPKFFTPNNDGINDFWQIQGVSAMFQSNSIIFIFDKYGKLLKQLHPLSQGWNGTFNGANLPADDYWFELKLQDGRVIREHFALRR